MKKKICYFCIGISIFIATIGWTKTSPNQNFDLWLYKIGAYNLFINKQPFTTSENIVPYLTSCFNLKRFNEIEKIFISQQKIINKLSKKEKAKAYLIWARTLRAELKYFDSVFAYSCLQDFLSYKDIKKLLKQEPNLELFFECTCLNEYWSEINPNTKKWSKILKFATTLWPKKRVFSFLQKKLENNQQNIKSLIALNNENKIFIKLILAHYLHLNNLMDNFYNKIKDKQIKQFVDNLFLKANNNTNIFNVLFCEDIKKFKEDKFIFKNEKIKVFIEKLNNYNLEESLELIRNQLQSLFIEGETKKELEKIYLCFLFFNDKYDKLNEINIQDMSSPKLMLATSIDHLNIDFNKIDLPYSKTFFKYILKLSGFNLSIDYPWNSIKHIYSPVGYYYAIKQSLQEKRVTYENNYKLSFLYPLSPLGQKAHLYLAKYVYKKGEKELAWNYLQKIQPNLLTEQQKIELLKAKAGILMDLNKPEQALATYMNLLSLGVDIKNSSLPPLKILKLGLLAQRLGKLALAETIFTNLLTFKKLPSSLKAEALFWLAETYQLQAKDKEAIEKYLELGYFYPKEHIWAITALYRAAQLSEKHKNFEMAKNLYNLVIKGADRKSQKQAAKQRLDALKTKQQFSFQWVY
ncbi:TolA-binding protein [Desulfonauticus submarinus]|uniref:TolA-binding protein n=1 Tax=Desulfonauticus submarinus TaxID=206665 RepID=A0A1H0A494_9BACT|nr:hypothetical protein [Desulfonauticus submarinus]SDN27526.1 TolA-binding protein [Desulfonauticus submarinus]